MRIIYIPENGAVWEQFYDLQASQSGHGIQGFEGTAYQRGGGLGNFLGRIFRSILPVVKSVGKKAAKAIGKEALSAGAHIVSDVSMGRNIKASAKEHGINALANLADQTSQGLKQKGNGMGRKQKISNVKAPNRKRKTSVGKKGSGKRSNNIDIFS